MIDFKLRKDIIDYVKSSICFDAYYPDQGVINKQKVLDVFEDISECSVIQTLEVLRIRGVMIK